LPLSVPIGRQDEPLACFAVNPENLVQAGQDAWEDVIDPTFNQVIGFGRTTVEIAGFIRRGEYGMDGFCNWTEKCLECLHIAPSLLEMRLERVAQAMIHLCVALFILFIQCSFTILNSGASEMSSPEEKSQQLTTRYVVRSYLCV
jgi:hypothetical protein